MKTVSSISTAGVWSCPATTGDRPPPCDGVTFTAVNDRRTVLFGGYNGQQGRMNDVFIIDLSTMVLACVCFLHVACVEEYSNCTCHVCVFVCVCERVCVCYLWVVVYVVSRV